MWVGQIRSELNIIVLNGSWVNKSLKYYIHSSSCLVTCMKQRHMPPTDIWKIPMVIVQRSVTCTAHFKKTTILIIFIKILFFLPIFQSPVIKKYAGLKLCSNFLNTKFNRPRGLYIAHLINNNRKFDQISISLSKEIKLTIQYCRSCSISKRKHISSYLCVHF